LDHQAYPIPDKREQLSAACHRGVLIGSTLQTLLVRPLDDSDTSIDRQRVDTNLVVELTGRPGDNALTGT
jgi:hypothetical protein